MDPLWVQVKHTEQKNTHLTTQLSSYEAFGKKMLLVKNTFVFCAL